MRVRALHRDFQFRPLQESEDALRTCLALSWTAICLGTRHLSACRASCRRPHVFSFSGPHFAYLSMDHEDIPDLVLLINLERRPSVQSLASLHAYSVVFVSMWNDYGIVATFSGNLEPRTTRRSHECASTLRMKCCGSCTRLNGECGSDECTGYEQIDHRHGFAM